jgi:hypothetical protein
MRRLPVNLSLPLFLFWPFGSFLLALFNIKSKVSAVVYVLFSTLFGYSFTFQSEGADSYRIALVFRDYFQSTSFQGTIELFKEGGITDIYLKLSYVIFKQFTDNPRFLFAWFGFVFGIFSYLSLRYLLDFKFEKNTKMLFVITLIFFSFYPLASVNGVRFNTAALIFFCSIINLFVYKKPIWLIGLFSTILIHFSFIIVIPIIIGLLLLRPYFSSERKNYKWVYIVFFITLIASLVIPTNFFSIGFLQDSDLISNSVSRKFDMYNSDDASRLRADRLESSLFLNVSRYFDYIIKVFILLLVLSLKKHSKNLNLLREHRSFIFIVLLFMSFGFIASSVPSGIRFLSIGYMFFYYLFFQIFNRNRFKQFEKFIFFMPLVYSFRILYAIVFLSISLTDSVIWYGNFFWILFA